MYTYLHLYTFSISIKGSKIFYIYAKLKMLFLYAESKGTQSLSPSEYEVSPGRIKMDYIPLDYKLKVVNMAREYPKWTLASFKANRGGKLVRLDELHRWRKDIERGGTHQYKYYQIS